MSKDTLFSPFNLLNLELKNRIVMAPMTRSMSPNRIPTAEAAQYYAERAKGNVALIITEGTGINHPATHAYPDAPNLFGEEALTGWKGVVDAVHAEGGKIFPQLWHVGSVRQKKDHQNQGVDNPQHCCHINHPETPGYGPSPIVHPFVENGEVPKVFTENDIADIISAYAAAAKDAKQIGFDGVELHAAHGYLIDQFFWDATNQREDQYGGKTLVQRVQFAVEVIKAVKKEAGVDFPLSFRISQWKLGDYQAQMAKTPEELEHFLAPLVDAGVDIFHCSTRRFYEAEFPQSDLNLAGWVKKLSGKPTITVGSVGLDNDFINTYFGETTNPHNSNIDLLLEKLHNDEFDLVAVGRMLLANPDWPEKIASGKLDEIIPFSQDKHAGMKSE